MHVGLNVLHLVPGETGGSELYARRLVPTLAEARPDMRLTLFAPRESALLLRSELPVGSVEVIRVPVSGRSRIRRVLAEQTLLPALARRARIDLLHNLFTTAPAFPGRPQVTTILDVIYRRIPETHPGLLSRGMALLVPLAARRSSRIITLSNAARDDIVEFLGVDRAAIDVTPLGPGMPHGVAPVAEAEVRRTLGLGRAPIVLSLSAKRPHKNLERLIDAFAAIERADPPVLVMPGYPTVFERELRAHAQAAGASDRVRLTGWVDEPLLEGLYRAATCLVFPSLAEGFGLPVLEAMLRRTPVACSDASSLPELAGDAALYFDPLDTAEMARTIERLLDDAGLRERLADAGVERARRFSWRITAEATLASYDRVLASA